MNPTLDQLNAISAAWTGRMGAVLWQSCVLALVIALVAWGLRRSSPAVRYWLWQILAIKLLVMPFWTIGVTWPALADDESAAPAAPLDAHGMPPASGMELIPDLPLEPVGRQSSGPVTTPEPSSLWSRLHWTTWLLLGWLLIVLWQVCRVVRQRIILARLLRRAAPAPAELCDSVRQAAGELGLRKTPDVRITDAGCSPFVCGLRRPVLVLSATVVGTLDAGELRHVLFHELAHVKRRDLLWGWIPEIARMAYFFHPIAHWMVYRLNLERELACDQIAMTHTGHDAGSYARTLVRVVSQQSEPLMLNAAAAGCVPPEETP